MFPHTLPPEEKSLLDKGVREALKSLDASITVQIGDHFNRDNTRVVAFAAIPGMLIHFPDHQGDSDPRGYDLCDASCPVADQVTTDGWVIQVKTSVAWNFFHAPDFQGATVWTSAFSGGSIAMGVTWRGSWRVALPTTQHLTPLVCEAAVSAAKAIIGQPGTATRHAGAGECLLSLPSPSDPSLPPLQLYFHNGTIMGGDSFTHRQVLSLPVGSAHEQAAARALLSAGP